MMPLPSARRAEDFAAALEGRAPDRPLDDRTERLVSLARAVQAVEQVEIRPQLAADLRARLVAEAELAGSRTPTRHRAVPVLAPRDVRRRRLTSIAAAACVTIGAGAGVAAASQSALPGDTLYPVKRGIEQVELTLAGGGEDRGQELLEQAGTRLVEAQDLSVAASDDVRAAGYVGETLQDFRSQATDGGEELIGAFESEGETDAIVELRTFVAESGESLDDLTGSVPPEAEDDLAAAAEALTDLDAAARSACPTCSDLEPLQLSSALLALRSDVGGLVDAPGGPDAPPLSDPVPAEPGATLPTGDLPTLPPPDQGSAGGEPDGGGAGDRPDDDSPSQAPESPDGPVTTLPTLDPSLPTLDPSLPTLDPSLPTLDPSLPSVPNPTEVLPTLLDPVETVLDAPLGDLAD